MPLLCTLALISLFMLTSMIEKRIKPYAVLQAEHFAQKTANEIIEHSVSEYLRNNKFTYNDFAAVLYDEKKKIVSVETIPYTINKTQSDLTLLINKELELSGKRTAKIALGSLTSSYLLTGKGPKINIRVSPIGVADVKLKSDFSEAGINQTRHRISAIVCVKMTSSVPLYSFETKSDFEFILAENILIGDVPDISPYATGKNSDKS
ncbi:sporulation protein YunB [Ruminococcus flavefaciens]|uniref:Sporulation protein YunB n=2 Tax=Oscillospiraceae TaxID=216572 RepID=A0A1M7H7I8_RUMFL|nr:sporulation protein YunB [Ruminococcus flavefaciens]